jgi:hypothetical protein
MLSLLLMATFLWGGCVSCEQFFMFPGTKQTCCNKSGQCERPGKNSSQPQNKECKQLPFGLGGNAHAVPSPAILPACAVPELGKPPAAATVRLAPFGALLDPSPPDRQALHATFLI